MPVAKSKVTVQDFVNKSRSYVERELGKVNTRGPGTLSKAEAAKLPRDLQDNYAKAKKAAGAGKAVNTRAFVDGFLKQVSRSAKKADTNKDGALTRTEAKKLEKEVQDNFLNLINAGGGGSVWTQGPKDTTPKALVAAHLKEYGAPPVTYEAALKKAITTAIKDEDSPESPRALLRFFAEEEGKPLTNAQADAQLKKLLKGLELLPVGESSESGGEPAQHWIFGLDLNVGSDHGFWVSVDRKTGEAFANGFN